MNSVFDLLMRNAEIVSAITVILVGGVPVYRLATRIESAVGKDEDGRTLSDRMARVEYQLWENGGDSLKDRVNQLDDRTIKMDAKLDLIQEIVVSSLAQSPARKVKKIRIVGNK